MGIPYYVASLLRQHKHIQRDCGNSPLVVDVLGIDFNCFIHKYLDAANPVGSIVVALNTLLTDVVRAKQVYIAFDGLVPLAKMVQQRYRRMKHQDAGEFDKHQISPGTPFMRELADTLRFMYPEIVVSDTLERGEGEHKIFLWLKTLPEDQRRKICIYGLDADLVLISIAQSHLGDIEVIREKDKEPGFATFSVNALKAVLPIDPETYVRMSVMCFGNDFMPSLAMFSLREDGYSRALYYANRQDAHKDEKKILLKRAKETDRKIVAPDGHALEQRFGCHLMDGVLNWEPVVYAFWKTFAWTLHYFKTSEVLDWNWYYPYPEAPLLHTMEDFPMTTEFTWEHPEPTFTVDDQLQFILPEESLKKTGLVPKHPDELYDENKEVRHPWMKRYVWECDPYVSLPMGPLTKTTAFVLPAS
jgi:5'-3' exonuclease